MYLSKAFDALSHDLLTGKLDGSGFGNHLLKLLFNYPVNRLHRTKANTSLNTWNKLQEGILRDRFYDQFY